MKAFCIFDDFPEESIQQLEDAGIFIGVVQKGNPRPTDEEMKLIFEKYEIVIIGTSQKIYEWMWVNINSPRIVATASVGIDHIKVPDDKKHLLTIFNTPTANAQSVAEYIVGSMLMAKKRYSEGNALYSEGKNNKALIRKPEDIHGATVGLVGAGRISTKIMDLLKPFGVRLICHTKNPAHHQDLIQRYNVEFTSLEQLVYKSDIISVSVPMDESTENLISCGLVTKMKNSCIFVSVSRPQVTDNEALIEKANHNPNFYLVLDFDVLPKYVGRSNGRNIVFTPHIAGGTVETRMRMFKEVTERIIESI